MTRLLIFPILVLMLASSVPAEEWGTIKGQFILDGPSPRIPPLVQVPAAACGPNAIPDESLVIDPENHGISNVFVFLTRSPEHVHPEFTAGIPPPPVEFDQVGCRFLPHALVLRTEQTVTCKSADQIPHEIFATPFSNRPLRLAFRGASGEGIPVQMPFPERLPLKLQSDVQPWMSAYWLVVDHPYAAVTDSAGKFTIKNLPTGEHEFRVWHERAGIIDRKWTISVKAGETQMQPRQIASETFLVP